jgi:hypothetical protein
MGVKELAQPLEPYVSVVVESYSTGHKSGLHGPVHVRPVAGQGYPTDMHVECPRRMKDPAVHKVGTRFRIQAKVTDKEGGKPFLYTSWQWKYDVLDS